MRCPICKKPADLNGPFSPFCSERCKTIDLGNWASEKYVVRAPLSEEDLERLEREQDAGKPRGNGEGGDDER